ncbi:MAG UNVERIFIED_CONTAM: hypothetical protein LVR18_35095 [Planctomycetaceae bacterium]
MCREQQPRSSSTDPEVLTEHFLQRLPAIQRLLQSDVESAFQNDPAAKTRDEIILCYPGIEAVCIYRLAHELLDLGVPYLPRLMTEWAHRRTGIDIHPAARIGGSFFIDHGTGVVIGETCEIGTGVTLYQGVTLGAWSFPRDEDGNLIRGAKRHPTLEDRVTIYSNATILGGTTVIGRVSDWFQRIAESIGSTQHDCHDRTAFVEISGRGLIPPRNLWGDLNGQLAQPPHSA